MTTSTSFAQMANNLLNVLQGYTNSIRLLLAMFLTLTVSAEVWGASIEINYGSSTTGWTIKDKEWSTKYWGLCNKTAYCIISPNFDDLSVITSVKVTTRTYGTTYSNSNKIGVYANATRIGTQQTATTTFTEYTFTPNDLSGNGAITIQSDGTATGAGLRVTKVIIEYNDSPKDPYTVTLNAGLGTCAASVTETSAGAGVTLPTPTLDGCGEWKFAGWKTTSAVTTETTTEPTLIAAGKYMPSDDITLYAVYQRTETPQGGGSVTPQTDEVTISDFGSGTSTRTYSATYADWTWAKNSGNNIATYDEIRLYASHSMKISPKSGYTISSIVATCTSSNYASALAGSSLSGADKSPVSGSTVTITPTSGDIVITQAAQSRVSKFTVTYSTSGGGGGSSTTYYHSTPDCGDPCASLQAPNVTATATANSITLSWAAVPNATSYNVYNYTTEDLDETTSLTYTFTGLSSETEYEWGVESAKGECFKETRGTTTTQETCTDAVNVMKGTPSNGSFTMVSGYQSTCNGPVTVTLSNIEPATGYQFSAITQSGVDAVKVTIDNTAKTVTYAKNTTGPSTINVTFTPAAYAINYKDQGGANFSGQHEAGYPQNHTYNTETTLKSASKNHYTFGGWYKESDCSGTEVTTLGATEYTENITLYAKWTAKTYTITLDANGGTFVDNRDSQTKGSATFDYIYGTYANYNDAPNLTEYYSDLKRDGYQFDKWVSAGSPWNKLFTSTGDRTIQAQWSKLYTITLSENGTTTTPTTQTSTSYTLPTELSAGTCQDDTKELVGWSTVEILNPGDKPTSKFYELGATITLTEDQTTFYAVFATPEGGGGAPVETTTTLDFSAQGYENGELVTSLTQGDVTITLDKGSNSNDTKYYTTGTAVRVYGGGYFTVSVPSGSTISSITLTFGSGDGSNGITVITGSYTSGTTSGTWTGSASSVKFSVGGSSGHRRIKTVRVTFATTTQGGTSYSDYTTTCVKLPDPVISFVTTPADPIVFDPVNCGSTTTKAQAKTVQVSGANLQEYVSVEVTGPYKIARTSSTNLSDYTTSLTLDKTAAGAIHSNYQTVYIISTPPAQSTEATTGTLTFTTTKGNTLTVNLSTPTVTCTQYTLTLVDRGVSTEQPTKYYAGETIDEAPADPEGVCTEPIHYVFDGWAEATIAAGSTTYTKVTFPYTVTGNTKFYAVYRYVEEGSAISGDYEKVTENLDDYSGDYLFVYETGNVAFDGGLDDLDVTSNTISVTINSNTIASNATTDAAKFTIAKVDGGYSIQSASGYYIGRSATSNGLSTNETYSANYDLNTITDCKTIKGKGGNILKYNKASDQKRFRYYQSGQEDIALYRKAASYLYTTSPVCGPHLVITEGKEIYVTGGNAGAARDLVMASQKVSYQATRLKTQDGSPEGTPPDVKVATNGITKGGVVTTEVKVTFENTVKELQPDDTYTITGDIVVTYEADANNLKEDIRVQLAVDYPANADARDNFTVHARSLPAEFVVVAKQGDKWYALNADMSGSKAQPANKQIEVDDIENPTMATFAPCNTVYTFEAMPQGASDRISVRFIGMENKYLWSALEGNTGIQNNSKNPTADVLAYNWKLYTTDNVTYQVGNGQNTRMLGLNSSLNFGMYAPVSGLVNDIRILPIDKLCTYNYAPTNLKVSVLKSTSVTLTWDAVAGATKYQYSTDGNTWTDAGTEPTVTINGLTEGKGYTYYIRAYHEDDATKECIDYSEISFTTADCDDVPADITYSADLTSITVTWTAVSTNCTVRLYSDEACTSVVKFADELKGSVTFSQLDRNTTYYVRVFAEGTCASPIVPVKTEDVELDIVEWDKDEIYVDINTNEKVSVTLENEVSYGSGSGQKADELFFSKYFEGSGSLKMIAIYNGTGKDVNLSEYRIDRGGNGDATDISKTYDLSQLGVIKQGQEIIFYSWPLTSEDSYSCSQAFLDSKAKESGLDANPRWILCDAKTHSGIEFEAMDFSGDDPLLFYKGNTLIDVFGVSTEAERPSSKEICSGRSDYCWSATGVSNMDYGKTTEDFPNGEIPYGVNVDDETITAYTARVIMFRKNTVVSGKNAVTKNTTTFATFADEWEARQVCRSGDDGDLTCAAYQELGTFDYSKYYTKFESMGDDLVFDTNSRNSDGTITVPISGLNTQSCRNIKITVKDAAGNVLKSQDYKVPIMITTDQETAYTDENKNQNAFYALQENLATVEVDGSGNPTGNKTNLTLEQVREICKTCDVVVRDNATLTKVTDGTPNDHPQVRNVYVYEGASIVIPDGNDHNYTINGLSLRRKGDVVASAQVQGTGKFVLPADEPVCLDLRVDANNWHWFTLPYDCLIEEVTWVDGTPAKYNTDWFLMYYDGESRAASTNPYDNHWKVYEDTKIEAGKGYIVGITGDLTNPDYTFELRFPMAQDVLTAEQTRKTVPVNAWGMKSDNKPNNLGWNLVGNPYLNYYNTADEYSLAGLPLIKYTSSDLVVGEFYEEENGNIPFLVTPIDGGWYEYQQELASKVDMKPFTAYFVQVGDPDNPDHTDGKELNASFEASNRGKKSIVRRAPREVEEIEEPIIVRVELTNSKGESDKTSLVIDQRFTNEYEMNGDFFKWFGDYYNYYTKPVLYTIGADQGKRAFNALNEELAKQPIPVGMYAAQAGNYTFSLNQQFDLSRVEEVWLYDATQSTYTNLMQSDYTFSTSKVNGAGRFSLSVKLAPKVATSIDNVTADKVWATTHTKQVIVNGLENGMHLWLYDATGKLLYNEPTSNYQHTYLVPQTGTYFVSVMNGNQKQTIKVVVE